ncbi:MAG: hypothetical protein AB9842_04845 [Bacteroidales bacterium]
MRINHKNSFIYLIIIILSITVLSCRSRGGASAAMKRIEDTKAEKAKEVQQQYDKAVKRHMDLQTKKTRKQMKELKKKSKKFNQQTKGK